MRLAAGAYGVIQQMSADINDVLAANPDFTVRQELAAANDAAQAAVGKFAALVDAMQAQVLPQLVKAKIRRVAGSAVDNAFNAFAAGLQQGTRQR